MNNIKRKLSFIGARTSNLFQQRPAEKIVYIHIPKCGGTSLNVALQNCYINWTLSDTDNIVNLNSPASWEAVECSDETHLLPDTTNDYSVMKFREKLLLYYMSQRHVDLISGHFPFSSRAEESFLGKYAFITVLRNPVDRWISSYFYNRNRQGHKYRKIEISIEDYIASEYGQSQGCEYAKFLGGLDECGQYMTVSAVAKAKENLHKFKLIGVLENMEKFSAQFESLFNRKIELTRLNQKPKAEDPEAWQFIEKSKSRILEICQPDIEIYEYAVRNFIDCA